MSTQPQPIPWKHLRYVLVLFSPLWISTALLFAVAGIGFSMMSRDLWTASQPMVLRDEATGALDRLGRFGSQTDLKAAQETTLEMARNLEVVAAALKAVGPPGGRVSAGWPDTRTVAGTARGRVNVRAPQGGDFGGSDMFYLQVEQESPQRAREFCEAMFESLACQMREVRRVRADSMIEELLHARNIARDRLKTATDQMLEIEVAFGSDLGELRSLTETVNGEGSNRRALEDTIKELQIAELEFEKLQSLRDFLAKGLDDPNQLLVSGAELLTRQPSLQRLKDGLIDAQLARSKLSGIMRPDHPKIRTAGKAEEAITQAMKKEITSVLSSMAPMMRIEGERVAKLQAKRGGLENRLERMALIRSRYSRVSSEVKHRTTLLEQAERALTDAEASRSAAVSTNLIAKLGPVTVGERPNGPSASMLAMGGGSAGLIFGLGLVFLVAPGPNQGSFGRRLSDRLQGRRASDLTADGSGPGNAGPGNAGPGNAGPGDMRPSGFGSVGRGAEPRPADAAVPPANHETGSVPYGMSKAGPSPVNFYPRPER